MQIKVSNKILPTNTTDNRIAKIEFIFNVREDLSLTFVSTDEFEDQTHTLIIKNILVLFSPWTKINYIRTSINCTFEK